MPQETKSMPEPVATLAGWSVDLNDPTMAFDALEKAFDYRGDITLHLSGGRVVAGYLFDRRKGAGLADSTVRLLPADGSEEKVTVPYADIRRIEFSSRDPAAGKSFETWVKKYIEKKLKGEKASIESESLE